MEKKSNYVLSASILIAALLIGGSLIYSTGKKNIDSSDKSDNVGDAADIISSIPQIDDEIVLGDPNAPVTIITFGDFQCPFCAKFYKETESLIVKNYVETGKAKLAFKALTFLGPESLNAALANECAKDQGKYWQFHDAIYEIEYIEFQKVMNGEIKTNEGNGNLNKELFKKIANDLNMATNDFINCYDDQKYKSELQKDGEEADKAMNGKISTPATFINGKLIQGAQPYEVFAKAIDEILKK